LAAKGRYVISLKEKSNKRSFAFEPLSTTTTRKGRILQAGASEATQRTTASPECQLTIIAVTLPTI
jgi:hypothetical protein